MENRFDTSSRTALSHVGLGRRSSWSSSRRKDWWLPWRVAPGLIRWLPALRNLAAATNRLRGLRDVTVN